MENPLLSTQSSDSGLQAILHPLVLLTISDYITRHSLREQTCPIAGALLGQQNGREITIDHAFECLAVEADGNVTLDATWFAQRLDQMKTVHKSPQLDLVGWYTVLPKTGPTPAILPIHNWLLSEHNESSLLLAFHPEEAVNKSAGSRLPLTIYESNYEVDEPKPDQGGEDREMRDGDAPLKLKFRELPYSVETGEAEMISMDFVARGAGNATMVEAREQPKSAATKKALEDSNIKGKGRAVVDHDGPSQQNGTKVSGGHTLSREDEELIASLTAKANAIKMLQSRINLLADYLSRLSATPDKMSQENISPSHPILRSIQALVNRLTLLVPSATAAFEQEMLSEANDVQLMTLLNEVMHSTIEVRNIGKKHHAVEHAKNQSRRANIPDLTGGGGSFNMPGAGDITI